jgi:hypothetical protein
MPRLHDSGRQMERRLCAGDRFFSFSSAGRTGHVACDKERHVNFGWGEQVNMERLIDVYRRSRSNFPTQVCAFISSRDSRDRDVNLVIEKGCHESVTGVFMLNLFYNSFLSYFFQLSSYQIN